MDNQTVMTAEPADVQKNKVMAMLGYLIFFLPLLLAKDSKFARYHANQATWVFIISLVASIVFGMVAGFLPAPLNAVSSVPSIFSLIYFVLGIMNVSKGEMKPLPGFATLPVLFK